MRQYEDAGLQLSWDEMRSCQITIRGHVIKGKTRRQPVNEEGDIKVFFHPDQFPQGDDWRWFVDHYYTPGLSCVAFALPEEITYLS